MRFLRSRPGVTFFVVLWLLVLFVPVLKEPFTSYAANEQFLGDFRVAGGSFLGSADLTIPYWPQTQVHSPLVQTLPITERYRSSYDHLGAILREYDQLADQNPPQAAWIIALRLRQAASHGVVMTPGKKMPNPPATPWLNAEALRETIQSAQRAERLEPQNAYFPQMEAIFHFASGDPKSGIEALQRGSRCSTWDDHTLEETYAMLESHNPGRPLVFEDKVSVWAAELLPHYGSLRALHHLVSDRGAQLLKQGHTRQALDIFEVVIRNGQLMRTNNKMLIGYLVGRDIERLPWQATASPKIRAIARSGNKLSYWQQLPTNFIQICKANGRPDLAKFTQRENQEICSDVKQHWLNEGSDVLFGIPLSHVKFALTAPYFAVVVALLAWCGALIWLFGALWPSPPRAEMAPRRGQIVGAANFTFWALAGIFALLVWKGVGAYFVLALWGIDTDEGSINYVTRGYIPYAMLLAWFLPVIVTSWRQRNKDSSSSKNPAPKQNQADPLKLRDKTRRVRPQVIVLTLFLCFVVFFASVSSASPYDVWSGTPFQMPMPILGFFTCVLIACLFSRDAPIPDLPSLSALARWRPQIGNKWPALLFGLVSLLLLVCFGVQNMGSFSWVMPLCALGGLLLLRFRSSNENEIPSFWQFAVRLACQTAGVLSLACSVVYLAIALTVWPGRAELNRNFETQLKIGEIARLRQQATQKAQASTN